MFGSIVVLDIKGFAKNSKDMSPVEIGDYLISFYNVVLEAIANQQWRIVKTMGDSILLSSTKSIEETELKELHNLLSKNYKITVTHRVCEYETRTIEQDNYKCEDIFGNDINCLFLNDSQTLRIG